MTDNEANILAALGPLSEPVPVRLLGGKDNSHHSRTLARLVARGWATHDDPGPRKGKRYSITPLGRTALWNHLELERLARAR